MRVPVVWHDAEVASHFLDFGWNLNCIVFLDIEVGFARPDCLPDILCHHQGLLCFDAVLQPSIVFLHVLVLLRLCKLLLDRLLIQLNLLLVPLEIILFEVEEHFALFDHFLELELDLLELLDHFKLRQEPATRFTIANLLLLVLRLLNQLNDGVIDAFDFLASRSLTLQMQVEWSLVEALLARRYRHSQRVRCGAAFDFKTCRPSLFTSLILHLVSSRSATARGESTCLLFVSARKHILVVLQTAIPAFPGLLEQINVVVQLYDFFPTCCDGLIGLSLHFLERLGAVLKQIHLEEVVFLEFLKVLPELLLLQRNLVVAIGVGGIEVDVGGVEFTTVTTNKN